MYLVDIGKGAVIHEGIGSHHTLRYLVVGAVAELLTSHLMMK
jgi:hypothetical protein